MLLHAVSHSVCQTFSMPVKSFSFGFPFQIYTLSYSFPIILVPTCIRFVCVCVCMCAIAAYVSGCNYRKHRNLPGNNTLQKEVGTIILWFHWQKAPYALWMNVHAQDDSARLSVVKLVEKQKSFLLTNNRK